MNLLGILENGLFALGQVLRFPVMLLLWVCVAFTLYFVGQSLILAIRRRNEHAGFRISDWLKSGPVLTADDARTAELPAELSSMLADIRDQQEHGSLKEGGLENAVASHEEHLRKELAGPRALVKIGPSLGLIGTLIPMGSSLAAMASGNLEAMAGQMVVAFTTTIVGLATGTIAYGIVAMRQGWVERTIREQRFMAERIYAEMGGK